MIVSQCMQSTLKKKGAKLMVGSRANWRKHHLGIRFYYQCVVVVVVVVVVIVVADFGDDAIFVLLLDVGAAYFLCC